MRSIIEQQELGKRIEQYEEIQEQIDAINHPYRNIITIVISIIAMVAIAYYILFC